MSKKFLIFVGLAVMLTALGADFYFSSRCAAAQKCYLNLSAAQPIPPVSLDPAAIDFPSLELALARLEFDGDRELQINASAESILSSASAALQQAPSPGQWKTINALLGKSFPARHSSMLFSVLQKFDAYSRALAKVIDAELDAAPDDLQMAIEVERTLQSKRELLQKKHLGESFANAMYAKQNILARKLLELRSLEMDASLSESEKRRKAVMIEEELGRLMSESEE